MSRWESYTTVRVTSYRDSTLISKPNNPYLLWLLYKQELRVSSYNKSSQITALSTYTFPRARDARNPQTADTHSHIQEGSPSITRIYGFGFPADLRGGLFTRPLLVVPASGAITAESGKYLQMATGSVQVLSWPWMAMNLITQYRLCCTNAQSQCGALEWQQLEHRSLHGCWN